MRCLSSIAPVVFASGVALGCSPSGGSELADARITAIDAALVDAHVAGLDAHITAVDARATAIDAAPIDAHATAIDAAPIDAHVTAIDAAPIDAHATAIDAAPIDAHTLVIDAHGSPDAVAQRDAGLPPAFEIIAAPTSNSAIGYVDSNGANAAVLFDNHGRAAQCRSGHVPEVDTLAFADCPSPDEVNVVTYDVQATAGKTDGSYRVDIQYTDENAAQQTYALPFYLHRELNGAALCDGDASWPTDNAFFAAATAAFTLPETYTLTPSWFDSNRNGALPHNVAFTDVDITPPTYQFGFTNITGNRATNDFRTHNGIIRIASEDDSAAISTTAYPPGSDLSFDLQLLSLRHRFVLNNEQTLLLVYRHFESENVRRWMNQHYCTMRARWFYHGRDSETVSDCDAYVMNSAGEGFCMIVDAEGNPQQSIFSRLITTKLIRGTFAGAPENGPTSAPPEDEAHVDSTMWGRNYYDMFDTEPDSDFIDTSNVDGSGNPIPVVILRP